MLGVTILCEENIVLPARESKKKKPDHLLVLVAKIHFQHWNGMIIKLMSRSHTFYSSRKGLIKGQYASTAWKEVVRGEFQSLSPGNKWLNQKKWPEVILEEV